MISREQVEQEFAIIQEVLGLIAGVSLDRRTRVLSYVNLAHNQDLAAAAYELEED